MNTERELLSRAAERLTRQGMDDLLLGDQIYRHLYGERSAVKPIEEKAEQED